MAQKNILPWAQALFPRFPGIFFKRVGVSLLGVGGSSCSFLVLADTCICLPTSPPLPQPSLVCMLKRFDISSRNSSTGLVSADDSVGQCDKVVDRQTRLFARERATLRSYGLQDGRDMYMCVLSKSETHSSNAECVRRSSTFGVQVQWAKHAELQAMRAAFKAHWRVSSCCSCSFIGGDSVHHSKGLTHVRDHGIRFFRCLLF